MSRPRIVCFGEVMLRLAPPSREMPLQSPQFEATVGGAEANVAVSLAHLGDDAALVTILADNAFGHAVHADIRKHGVDTQNVRFAKGRLGLYFVTQGAGVRASEVLYDRARSAFAEASPDLVDWTAALAGADRLHLSGVTPAIGANGAAAAQRAAREAARLGVKVSFDGNYRATLWSEWDGDAPAILRSILEHADIAFMDERDIALVLKRSFASEDVAVREAFAAFPKLARIAATRRVRDSSGTTSLGAALHLRDKNLQSAAMALGEIVDRIGSGDAFAAGFLHGLHRGFAEQEALDFALAAAAWKHSVPGDFNPASESELRGLLRDGPRDVRR